ncbi:superinfection immunity protein [Streptomyces sp. BA2]|uniref:superinfection immunity protein n=1 Tax=Streptomyces sp. BA2 TaxID=436595 RepID=UPI00136E8B68|nr:superinfection immunity protein [Streptomyces sp. BA2]
MLGSIGLLGAALFALLSLVAFLLPSLIAFNRGIENRWLVLVVNLVLGVSVIGWLIALYLATRKGKAPLPGPPEAPG